LFEDGEEVTGNLIDVGEITTNDSLVTAITNIEPHHKETERTKFIQAFNILCMWWRELRAYVIVSVTGSLWVQSTH